MRTLRSLLAGALERDPRSSGGRCRAMRDFAAAESARWRELVKVKKEKRGFAQLGALVFGGGWDAIDEAYLPHERAANYPPRRAGAQFSHADTE